MEKVLFINTSSDQTGVLRHAIDYCVSCLKEEGIDAYVWNTEGKIHPCTSCGKCIKQRKCIFEDAVNQIAGSMKDYDGVIIGSDVFYGEPDEQCVWLLERLFRSSVEQMADKPASVILHARSGKGNHAFNEISQWFHYADMPVITSFNCYTVQNDQDEAGMESLRKLAQQMAWLLKSIEAGKEKGVTQVCDIPDKLTDFTR